MDTKDLNFDTKLIHSDFIHDEYGSATVPIYQTSTFAFKNAKHGADLFAGKGKGYIYTRMGNPTIEAFERKLAELENGFDGIALSSGMAAINTVYMALLDKDSHILSTDAVYGPSRVVLDTHYAKFGVEYSFIDTSVTENITIAIKPNTKVLYIETPANPTMALTNILEASEIAHKHGIIVVVDNTFSSPCFQKPLNLGADVVVHSLTKYINGHADIIGGAIIAKSEDIYDKLRKTMVYTGGNMDTHQSYMIMRGMKTLSLRMQRSEENAMIIAGFLENHPQVKSVKYPGLKSFPQYELAKKQMTGFGGMISFELKGGIQAGTILMNNVKLATLAVSLGGVETLIQHPASMTHAGMTPEKRHEANITDGLVRYSVGIEDVKDLLEDLSFALDQIK